MSTSILAVLLAHLCHVFLVQVDLIKHVVTTHALIGASEGVRLLDRVRLARVLGPVRYLDDQQHDERTNAR